MLEILIDFHTGRHILPLQNLRYMFSPTYPVFVQVFSFIDPNCPSKNYSEYFDSYMLEFYYCMISTDDMILFFILH